MKKNIGYQQVRKIFFSRSQQLPDPLPTTAGGIWRYLYKESWQILALYLVLTLLQGIGFALIPQAARYPARRRPHPRGELTRHSNRAGSTMPNNLPGGFLAHLKLHRLNGDA